MVSVVLGVLRSGLNPQSSEANQDRILTTDVREFYLSNARVISSVTLLLSFSHAALRA
jgi:hypothetical protein